MFKMEHEGKLYDLKDVNGGFLGIIRFSYKKNTIQNVFEGDFVACENFFSTEGKRQYTLMKITSIFPRHYALEAIRTSGYPTFLKEVVRNIVEDWETDISTETFILATASPVGYDLVVDENRNRDGHENGDKKRMSFEKKISKPMPGKNAEILDHDTMQQFLRWGLEEESIEIGSFRRDTELSVYVNLTRMIRRHFGVFGSTGTGKSNFLAQLIRTILGCDSNVRIILFDILGEYPALLADVLKKNGIIFLDEGEVADNFKRLVNLDESSNQRDILTNTVALELSQTSKKPGRYEGNPDPFISVFQTLLRTNRIRLLKPVITSGMSYVQDFVDWLNLELSEGMYKSLLRDHLEIQIIHHGIGGEFTEDKVLALQGIVQSLREHEAFTKGNGELIGYARGPFSVVETCLERIMLSLRPTTEDMLTPIEDIVEDFVVAEESDRLCLVLISDPEEMRRVLSAIVGRAISHRKRNPTFPHDVLFVFDEAHEYIPAAGSEEAHQEGVRSSRKALMRLSRQGRKFGLGMCLATQRTTYLDTIVMGQVHTFFAGFLPRKVDRERIGEAFNIDEATLVEVQEFTPGEWLLSSAVATGLINVPIALRAENSEEILEKFFSDQSKTHELVEEDE